MLIVIALYVDDIIILFNDTNHMNKIKTTLFKRYDMRDFGSLSHCLGLKVIQDGNSITVNQKHLIEDTLKY